MTARPDPRVGSDLGPYRIESVIGRGGMGVVYLATHAGLDRRVALKLLAPDYADDEAFRARFLRESRMAAAIDHPNIIPIYDAGDVDGTYFLAMRYVEGTDLETLIRAGPARPARRDRRSSSRSRAPSTPPTRPGSSTATSSRPTSSSPRARGSTGPTTRTSPISG